MELGLHGTRAIVTASSAGLGHAIAMGLAREGAHLVINGRREAQLEHAAQAIREDTGADVLAVPGDLAAPGDAERIVAAAVAEFGGIDIVVANTGGPPAGRFVEFDDAAWSDAIELQLLSLVRLVRAAHPHLVQAKGALVFSTSSTTKQPAPGLILSNSVRASVAGLAKTLAHEFAPDVRVLAVAPGRIATDRVKDLDRRRAEREQIVIEEVRAASEARIPLRRYGTPEEYANVVVFLASSRASYVTGATVQVDGGLIASLF
jgi:3-oxoacyl-[acyl-carrier protein] reductase